MGSSNKVLDVAIAWGAIGVLALAFVGKAAGITLPPLGALALWLVLAFGGAVVLARGEALALLGLTRFDARGVGVALAGSLLMLAGLAIGSETGPHVDLAALWDAALRPGVVEELLFRGLAFGVLFWRAGWSFPAAMLSTGIVFGAFHIPGAVANGTLDEAWGVMAITAAGGCWFAWLYARWRSLWVPIAAHVAMNAWWVLYTAGPHAASGGSGALWGRVAAIVAITLATGKLTDEEPSDPVG